MSTVTDFDRLTFTVFLAAGLHAAAIFGVVFTREPPEPAPRTLEVTIAQFASDAPPEDADFLAQHDQRGSGTLDERRDLTTTEAAEIPDLQVRQTQPEIPLPPLAASAALPEQADPLQQSETSEAPVPSDATPEKPLDTQTLVERFRELASLDARLDAQRQDFARKPRVRRLTSVSTRRTVDAYYMANWRRRIERIGTDIYQAGAHRKRLFGSLRMLVTILPDGSLKKISVLESSGHAMLDETAVRIVERAAPYAPFPEEMRREVDELEIIRTFQFRSRGMFESS